MNQHRIGIMGGSFDPIHYGHLVLAEEVRSQFELEKILFIPNGIAPHKRGRLTDSEDRLQMTQLATADNVHFEVSRFEIDREEVSYTVDTLRYLKQTMGEDIDLYFITGADALLDLNLWKSFEEVLKLCTFVGATRPGYMTEDLAEQAQYLRDTYDAKIELLEIPGLAISSTEVRNRVQSGKSIRYLVPKLVQSYIEERGLYVENDPERQ